MLDAEEDASPDYFSVSAPSADDARRRAVNPPAG